MVNWRQSDHFMFWIRHSPVLWDTSDGSEMDSRVLLLWKSFPLDLVFSWSPIHPVLGYLVGGGDPMLGHPQTGWGAGGVSILGSSPSVPCITVAGSPGMIRPACKLSILFCSFSSFWLNPQNTWLDCIKGHTNYSPISELPVLYIW